MILADILVYENKEEKKRNSNTSKAALFRCFELYWVNVKYVEKENEKKGFKMKNTVEEKKRSESKI